MLVKVLEAMALLGLVAGLAGCEARKPVAVIELTAEQRAGSLVYARSCASCHAGGMGMIMGPSLHRTTLDDAAIRARVRQGRNLMPAFRPEQLDDEQLDALIDYLRTLRR